jgi:DNA-binding transcriptional ArsR family regulator
MLEERILDICFKPVTSVQLSEATGVHIDTVRRSLAVLRKLGMVEKIKPLSENRSQHFSYVRVEGKSRALLDRIDRRKKKVQRNRVMVLGVWL